MSEEKVKNIKTEEREQEEKQIVYDGTNHKRILSDEEMNKKNTIVINAFAGPSAGKTTSAHIIVAELKKRGYVTEFVSEVAKEMVWDEKFDLLDGSIEGETVIYNEKKHRIDRLINKVDFIVTDSPTIQSICFLKDDKVSYEQKEQFTNKALNDWKNYNTFNYFVERDLNKYEEEGRIHTLDESIEIDNSIKRFLNENDIYYGNYRHDTVDKIIDNIITSYKKLNKPILKEKLQSEENKETTTHDMTDLERRTVHIHTDDTIKNIAKAITDKLAEQPWGTSYVVVDDISVAYQLLDFSIKSMKNTTEERDYILDIWCEDEKIAEKVNVQNAVDTIYQNMEYHKQKNIDIPESMSKEETKVNNDKEQIDALINGEKIEGKITYYAINESEAQVAHSMKYYYPYEHGTKTKEYRAEVDKIYDMVTKISKVRPEVTETAYQLANQFSKQMADNMNQAIKVECMCPSDMIAGAKNISAEMRKQQDTARMKNQEEYRKIKKIEKRLDDILTGKEKIKKKTINQTKESDEKSIEEKENTKHQQQPIEGKKQEQPKQTIEKSGIEQNNKYFKAVENMELEKLQLMFNGKPNEKMRDILKDNHFHWSWENKTWERILTDEAMESTSIIAAKFEELDKQGKLEFEKSESSKPSHTQNKKFHGRKFEERDYDYSSLEKQLTLSRDRKYQEKIQGGLEPKLDQSQDKLHQEQLGMVEDVNIEIEIGE